MDAGENAAMFDMLVKNRLQGNRGWVSAASQIDFDFSGN